MLEVIFVHKTVKAWLRMDVLSSNRYLWERNSWFKGKGNTVTQVTGKHSGPNQKIPKWLPKGHWGSCRTEMCMCMFGWHTLRKCFYVFPLNACSVLLLFLALPLGMRWWFMSGRSMKPFLTKESMTLNPSSLAFLFPFFPLNWLAPKMLPLLIFKKNIRCFP